MPGGARGRGEPPPGARGEGCGGEERAAPLPRNPTDAPTRFLVELRPGHAGFEKAIKAGYGLAADGLTAPNGVPKNPYHLAVLLGWSEMRIPGLFTLVEPVLRLLARRARRKGIDRELEARYCR